MIAAVLLLTILIGIAMLIITTHEYFKGKLPRGNYALWSLLWIALTSIGLFPDAYAPLASSIGLAAPIQFVTTFAIVILFLLIFQLNYRLNSLDKRLVKMTQTLALATFDRQASDSNKEIRKRK